MNLLCVMVIDDSEPDQFICKMMIEGYDPDIKILQAYDGQEALEILDATEHSPDVIFLDINMPRMDGHEFLAMYDKRDEAKSTVVVMLTSSSQEEDRDRSLAHQCVKSYLIKPLDAKNLEELSESGVISNISPV
jgi:CheY-like chemotaxis protein